MSTTLETPPRFAWLQHVTKTFAVVASTGAAIASIVTALHSNGVIGKGSAHVANAGAAWVRLTPAVDTATAIGDTIPFAATIADRNGSILGNATPTWTTGDSTIATVTTDGSVVARRPGQTTVSVVVGKLVSNARILVKQKVASVTLTGPAGDTAVAVGEGSQLQLRARAFDARGHAVAGRTARWTMDDTLVAGVDEKGTVTGQNAGHGQVTAAIDGETASLPVAVISTATELAVVAGSGQRALAGRALPQHVVVRATTRKGGPAAGKLVSFRLRGAQGTLEPLTATTDADGRARTLWTLGGDPGPQALLASVESVDSIVVVEAEAEPTAGNTRIAALAGHLRARAGARLDDSVGVRLTDSAGRALSGIPVRWTAVHGTVDAIAARTDSAGVARARWTLGPKTGTQRLRAIIGSADSRIAPTEISATALSGPASAIVLVSGEKQEIAAGKLLARPIVLRVVDQAGNPAAEVPVSLTPSAGTVSEPAPVTDSLGLVKIRWTMGHSAGDYTLAARVEGVKKALKVTARGTPASPANLTFDDVPPPKGAAVAKSGAAKKGVPAKPARPGPRHLVALVTDIYGNPVADTPVTFSAGAGAVTPARAVTDARGRVAVQWTMGPSPADLRLRGTVRGTDVTGAYLGQR